ncbi:serine/threonine protein kinase [Haloactinospora alba]|uniref:non-specific serine/threonine protein kinase n=1 Tax=Haloactinospora alba TaxID=405555 RepID=A0A543NG00_9ACTN|nr:serine/threonine-protein kinase [Haloactinospora alba]TQN30767.1 serine/threonine protein kinase [Haloactinospora alba]
MSGPENAAGGIAGIHSLTVAYRGRNAQIYRAVRTSTDAAVALKVMGDAAGFTELAALRDLGGAPGVVPLLDAGRTAGGEPYIVMPFCPDGSYAQILGREGRRGLREAAAVGRAVASALAALHNQHLLHNEVVPGNILRTGTTAVLTDFGTVDAPGSPPPQILQGSEAMLHAPPEVLRGEPGSASSDVYQLASTLWTLLAGRTPYASGDGTMVPPREYMQRVLTAAVPPVPRADVPTPFNAVLARALAKNPADRYPGAADFAADLEQARLAQPPEQPTTPVESVSEPPLDGKATQPYDRSTARMQARQGMRQRAQANEAREQEPPAAAPPAARREEAPAEETAAPAEEGTPESQAAHSNVPSGGAEIPDWWLLLDGWSGTADDSLPRLPQSAPGGQEQHSPAAPPERPRWRRHLHIAAAVVSVTVLTSATGVLATVRFDPDVGDMRAEASESDPDKQKSEDPDAESGDSQQKDQEKNGSASREKEPSPDTSPTGEVPAASNVWITDNGNSVQLHWADQSGGAASYYILGSVEGGEPRTMTTTGAGVETAQADTPDSRAEYCFTVIAVDGTATPASEVCTNRAAARAEAQQEREEQEEESEDADSGGDSGDGEENGNSGDEEGAEEPSASPDSGNADEGE